MRTVQDLINLYFYYRDMARDTFLARTEEELSQHYQYRILMRKFREMLKDEMEG